jgi:hypothetical protein
MTAIQALMSIVGWIAVSSAALAQDIAVPKDVLDRLQQQAPTEQRKLTVAPDISPSAASAQQSADADKMRSVQNLLEQVEKSKGAQAGTLKAIAEKGTAFSLQHDLGKIRENYSALAEAPFGKALSGFAFDSTVGVATSPAAVEYKTKDSHDSFEKIVSIKSKAAVAANAFASGERPVSLKVANANLTASQIPSTAAQLAVNVKVGGETRKLNVGDVSRFENFEVTVLASANLSGKPNAEGFPYVLRLQVMPLQ